MKHFSIVVLTTLLFTSCGPTIYKSENFKDSKSTVHIVAILPFSVSIDSKRLPKGQTIETLRDAQQKTGYDIQNNVYTWFLHRQNEYSVTFQDIDKTNAILTKANITYDNIIMQEKGELCKLLNVDAVISGKAVMSKPMSEAGAIAVEVLVGFGGATNKTDVTLTIHDIKSSLLWKYDHQVSGSLGSSPEKLTNALMRNSSKNFPYKKK
ncbi:MAG: hypothetical protein ABJA78_08855 [Ferruginibacter sp.]